MERHLVLSRLQRCGCRYAPTRGIASERRLHEFPDGEGIRWWRPVNERHEPEHIGYIGPADDYAGPMLHLDVAK